MSKPKRNIKRLWPYALAVLLFFLTSFVQLHRGPAYSCVNDDGRGAHTAYRLEYGFPMSYIKRSVSDFECKLYVYGKADQRVTENDWVPSYFTIHEISVFNFLVDLYVWLSATYILMRLYEARKRRQT